MSQSLMRLNVANAGLPHMPVLHNLTRFSEMRLTRRKNVKLDKTINRQKKS